MAYKSNQFQQQCLSIRALAPVQAAKTAESIRNIADGLSRPFDKIYIVGNGDSLVAADNACYFFRHKFDNAGVAVKAVRCLDSAKYDDELDINKKTLGIFISASGSPVRVAESIDNFNKQGALTVVVTNNISSICASKGEVILYTNTPDFPGKGPGLRNYFASLISTYMLCVYLLDMKCQGVSGSWEDYADRAADYICESLTELQARDEMLYQKAELNKDVFYHNIITDADNYHTGKFITEKFAESLGQMCNLYTVDQWIRHLEFNKCRRSHANIFLTQNIDKELMEEKSVSNLYLRVDDLKEQPASDDSVPELDSLINYLPSALYISHLTDVVGEPYFRGDKIWGKGADIIFK